MTSALKPCPFCGGKAEFERTGTPRHSCIVRCTNCGCHHESSDENEHSGSAWNDRAIVTEELSQSLTATPRTDAAQYHPFDNQGGDHEDWVVEADFARQLERELAEARSRGDLWHKDACSQAEKCRRLEEALACVQSPLAQVLEKARSSETYRKEAEALSKPVSPRGSKSDIEVEKELAELRAFRDAAFQAHPNIDLDISHLPPLAIIQNRGLTKDEIDDLTAATQASISEKP